MRPRSVCVAALGLALTACPPGSNSDGTALAIAALLSASTSPSRPCAPYTGGAPSGTLLADTVLSAPASTGVGNDDSYCAINGIRGLGTGNGSLDVFSLTGSGAGASIVLRFAGKRIVNNASTDFIVYENPFNIGGSPTNVYLEPAIVEVSQDNATYCGFNPNYTFVPETTFSSDPSNWSNFAGLKPVLYNQESNPLSAANLFVQATGGGDFFDLSNLETGGVCDAIRDTNAVDDATRGFTYLRITSSTARTNPDTGAVFVSTSNTSTSGADIDGVIARYAVAQ